MKVGKYEKKDVTVLNNTLFKKAEEMMEENCHLGWSGLGKFIDWLEANYTLEKKTS